VGGNRFSAFKSVAIADFPEVFSRKASNIAKGLGVSGASHDHTIPPIDAPPDLERRVLHLDSPGFRIALRDLVSVSLKS